MSPPTTFADLGLDPRLVARVAQLGFDEPTPIQAEAIPPLLAGHDVIGRARTGSGKTAAYGLPLLHQVAQGGPPVRALVLAPTRELALQVTEALRDLGKGLPVKVVTVYGGAPYPPQLKALSGGVPVVVGTPGRVLDHLRRGSLDLSQLELLVLDEADEMLRMGFLDDVETVLAAAPPDRRIALLSATMPDEIRRVAGTHLRDPVELQLDDDGPRVDHVPQQWMRVPQRHKLEALTRVLASGSTGATLVFARTRRSCGDVADALTRDGIAADALHGDLTQAARERVVHRLRSGGIEVVVATDVAARGIDVEHIGRVINLDLPDDVETYVHRIGRTARAGRSGLAITFVTSSERPRLSRFARSLGVEIVRTEVPSDDDIVAHRQGLLRGALAQALLEDDLGPARAWVRLLAAEDGWDLEDVAAAAVQRLAVQGSVDLGAVGPTRPASPRVPEPREPAPHREPPPAREPAPPREAAPPREPPPAREASPPREPPPRREPPPPRGPAPRDDGPPRWDEGDMVELFVPAGSQQGVRAGDLVGSLARGCGVPGEAIGRITIHDRKSFVSLPVAEAERVLAEFPVIELRRRHVRLDRARPSFAPAHRGPGGKKRGR
ncbi:MAG: DEAD/DEAH box helicase [Alphaproteobacteria bacterium]|nr:DEAD/DEAH box helicase [Alphaproteobacteria bacterium]